MNWYVIYTKPRAEKKTADLLERRGIETYCPVQRQLRQWSDRKKWVEMVVIPSYVFVRCEENQRHRVINEPGVLNFVYWLGKPALVRDEELKRLQDFLQEYNNHEISYEELKPGTKIRVEGGPMDSKTGVVVKVSKTKARIEFHGMGMAFIATIKRSQVKKEKESAENQ
ncbi:MAG: UpxY family transcription antiterminator [Cryomorphaceae bacterium]|nr:UpxY family transcription antiterminator [Cryomorphaceae bacterium]